MASPHVVGVAALVKSAHPDWDNKTIRGQLDAGADDLGTAGYDTLYGFGLVNAAKDTDGLIANPPQPPAVSPRVPPTVVTLDATNISSTGATLNGQLTSMGSYATLKVWFAIGKVGDNVSSDSTMQQMSSPGPFYFTKTSLLPGTQYWFFAIAYDGVNGYTGNQLVFATLASPSPSPTPSPTPTPSPSPSPTPTPSPAPIDSVITQDTSLKLLSDSLVFETTASISGSGVASGSAVANAIVTIKVVGPGGSSYNLSGISDSTGKVNIILKKNPTRGSWRATVTNVVCSYPWDKQDSLTSANLKIKKALK